MIYLEMRERLGNQLFQYAFARRLQQQYNDNLTINVEAINAINNPKQGWKNGLDDFNVIEYVETMEKKYSFIQKVVMKIYWHFNSRIPFGNRYSFEMKYAKILSKFGVYWLTDGYIEFCKPFPFIKDKIVKGYFESPKYFSSIDEIIKNEFIPKKEIIESNLSLYHNILNSESICVTIRRGDFLNSTNKPKVYVCTEEYFYRGVDLIKEKYPEAKVFIFSDDVDWVRENMNFGCQVEYETGKDPVWEKLRLMSACKHFVISNSTFSWWAQHLSNNKDKMVIAPSRWRNDKKPVNLYEHNWILIDPQKRGRLLYEKI